MKETPFQSAEHMDVWQFAFFYNSNSGEGIKFLATAAKHVSLVAIDADLGRVLEWEMLHELLE